MNAPPADDPRFSDDESSGIRDARVPPQDLDAESTILSALLTDATAFDELEPVVRAEHFYSDANRRIFQAVAALRSEGKPADIATVTTWLREHGRLSQVGGAAYVAQVGSAPFAVALEDSARRVLEKYRLRAIIDVAHHIAAEAYAGPENAGLFVQAAEQRMFEAAGDATARVTAEPMRAVMHGCMVEIAARYRGDSPRGVSTGFKSLDMRIGGLRNGRLYVCAGRPGMGKTSFLEQVARSVAENAERRGVFLASLEMPREQLGDRFISQATRLDTRKVELGMLTRDEWRQVGEASAEIAKLPIIIDDASGVTVAGLRSALRRATRKLESEGHALGLVGIDYFQLMGTGARQARDNEAFEAMSLGILNISKEFDVPVILLSQLNREVEKREGKRPQLSDLRSSGALEQDAHTVIFFYRGDMYLKPGEQKDRTAEFIVAKARGGRTGTVNLSYLEHCTLFLDEKSDDSGDELAGYYEGLGDFAAEDERKYP
jgi:replicative DNA helicase